MTKVMKKKTSDNKKVNYRCYWCGHQFEKIVEYRSNRNDVTGDSNHSAVSTQVKCPSCTNFIKTWPEGR